MGTNYYAVKKKPTLYNRTLHIGKASAGWKFLFHDHDADVWEGTVDLHTYEQWKEYLMNNDEIVILNEYNEKISVEDLFKEIDEKQSSENKDNFKYNKNVNGYRFASGDFS